MADVTNPAFRFIAHNCGADFTYTEMIHADGFNHGDPYAKNRGFSINNFPYGIQIVGNDSVSIAKAAAGLEELFAPAVRIFDINMGCPAPPILKTGCGASLMAKNFDSDQHPSQIVRRVCDEIKTPVSAKIRIYNDKEKTIRLAKSLEDAGASVLTIHGRTKSQMYSGSADWKTIGAIQKELSIPVILNGDIVDEKSLQAAMDLTNCDGYMIGRAAIGNPGIFRKLKSYLKTGTAEEVSPPVEFKNRIQDLNQYFSDLKKYNLLVHVNVSAHAQWFTKGLPGSREMRLKINALHKDIRIRHFSDEELAAEREALASEILVILNEYAEKCEREFATVS